MMNIPVNMTLSVDRVSRWRCPGGGRGDERGVLGDQADPQPGEPAASGNIPAACTRADRDDELEVKKVDTWKISVH